MNETTISPLHLETLTGRVHIVAWHPDDPDLLLTVDAEDLPERSADMIEPYLADVVAARECSVRGVVYRWYDRYATAENRRMLTYLLNVGATFARVEPVKSAAILDMIDAAEHDDA